MNARSPPVKNLLAGWTLSCGIKTKIFWKPKRVSIKCMHSLEVELNHVLCCYWPHKNQFWLYNLQASSKSYTSFFSFKISHYAKEAAVPAYEKLKRKRFAITISTKRMFNTKHHGDFYTVCWCTVEIVHYQFPSNPERLLTSLLNSKRTSTWRVLAFE